MNVADLPIGTVIRARIPTSTIVIGRVTSRIQPNTHPGGGYASHPEWRYSLLGRDGIRYLTIEHNIMEIMPVVDQLAELVRDG